MLKLIILFSGLFFGSKDTSSIELKTRDAIVWHPKQEIKGQVHGINPKEIIIYQNGKYFSTGVDDKGVFKFELCLTDKETKVWAEVPGHPPVVSDTVQYTLGYDPIPIVKPYPVWDGEKITLHADIVENPYGEPIKFHWAPDSSNPALTDFSFDKDSLPVVEIPAEVGMYRFNLIGTTENDSIFLQTYVKRDNQGVHAFNMDEDSPQWMDDAILYQITPYSFVKDGTFNDIRKKLHELKEFGVNTIMIQPIYRTFKGYQGYDVIDYMQLNPNFGTREELHSLIKKAKKLKIRILFDLVINHSSIHHPYAKDLVKNGDKSHYHDFYQHEVNDGKPYSSLYNKDEFGFVNYFWKDLVNLNYGNEEVQRWMLEVCKYWLNEFDIDGYRFDAIWGVNARNPSFGKRLRTELKSIKPDFLFLAEDKGSSPAVYELGFDAAYDWTKDKEWVSQWSWEYEYDERSSKTIFNHPKVHKRAGLLGKALFKSGGNPYRKLHYLENNDLPRFIVGHGLERTKMAATLLFSLPGIPMIYNGQEIGFENHPYSDKAIFAKEKSIQEQSKHGLFEHYKKLIRLHKAYPALRGNLMDEVRVLPKSKITAFVRKEGGQIILVLVNLDGLSQTAALDPMKSISPEAPMDSLHFRDLLSNEVFSMEPHSPKDDLSIPMQGYSVRLLLMERGVN
ncbi:alpha-amylase family glycosyl hydrolase [Flagellimonas iocasae]|uniref:Alpha-amylase family glycosyl hydrolase n=1 Tax=Flagellimonas iocasae TaxID=2055905 RepID=A0ABW4Y1L3_9FLAO